MKIISKSISSRCALSAATREVEYDYGVSYAVIGKFEPTENHVKGWLKICGIDVDAIDLFIDVRHDDVRIKHYTWLYVFCINVDKETFKKCKDFQKKLQLILKKAP